ncbi:hypothetical protein [Desmospora profundinema]|uniref:Uncharacterized protein n=1 Tax=Desmospora profundinema TaxID=1571184 RepID=A0ABU1IH53_9BACL|nr:hypothetical protein [Desmospora profundinema]MDR6224105.1 hypothetical protein [Desmospora profundinema]
MQLLKGWLWKLKGEQIACYTRLSPMQFQPGTIRFGHRITRVVPHGQVWAVWGKPKFGSPRV